MNKSNIDRLLRRLMTMIFELAAEHNVSIEEIIQGVQFHGTNLTARNGYTSSYDSKSRCIAYALRYGIKTSYQTWMNLSKSASLLSPSKVLSIGGGCSFEIPIILNFIDSSIDELEVVVLDVHSRDWKFFKAMHESYAAELGIELNLRFRTFDLRQHDLDHELKIFDADLVVISNLLNEIDDSVCGEIATSCSGRDIFIQDPSFEKLSGFYSEMFGSFAGKKFANEIKDFPYHFLKTHLETVSNLFENISIVRNINSSKNYFFHK